MGWRAWNGYCVKHSQPVEGWAGVSMSGSGSLMIPFNMIAWVRVIAYDVLDGGLGWWGIYCLAGCYQLQCMCVNVFWWWQNSEKGYVCVIVWAAK